MNKLIKRWNEFLTSGHDLTNMNEPERISKSWPQFIKTREQILNLLPGYLHSSVMKL